MYDDCWFIFNVFEYLIKRKWITVGVDKELPERRNFPCYQVSSPFRNIVDFSLTIGAENQLGASGVINHS